MKFQDGANRIRKDFIGYGHLSKLYLDSYLLLQKNCTPMCFYKNTSINFLSVTQLKYFDEIRDKTCLSFTFIIHCLIGTC